VEIYLDRLQELRRTILWASGLGGLGTLMLVFLFARRMTRPIRALTVGVTRVAAGDLSQSLPVLSRDEVGQLTRAFNGMLEGLRQRDFIRSAFGRYVSPEVAKALLESPGGLRFGGEKRVVTCSCRTCAATRDSPSAAIPPWSWRCSTASSAR
jgi:HAMP domain-containing protein